MLYSCPGITFPQESAEENLSSWCIVFLKEEKKGIILTGIRWISCRLSGSAKFLPFFRKWNESFWWNLICDLMCLSLFLIYFPLKFHPSASTLRALFYLLSCLLLPLVCLFRNAAQLCTSCKCSLPLYIAPGVLLIKGEALFVLSTFKVFVGTVWPVGGKIKSWVA